MFETGRRSATSTSELGLYSDRSDHYHRNRYGIGVRKYVIGVMVVLAIILVSVLLYDFTSGATVINNGAKDTKHIYILQNALKRPINSFKKTTTTAGPFNLDNNKTELTKMEDRSDGNYEQEEDIRDSEDLEDQIASETRSITIAKPDPEFRGQNLNNFNLRKRLLSMDEDDENEEKVQRKQLFDNQAMIYRLRQRYKYPISEEDTSLEESRPLPFHFEYKTPIPTSFKRSKYPQLSQYRYPQSSNNIQDIIKYLTKDNDRPNRGIKFSGVYVNPKKVDLHHEAGEMMSNSDRSEEENPSPISFSFNSDPFYQYKPKNPSDVNLLATSNVRFSPSGAHRYNPNFYDPYFPRPPMNFNMQQPSSSESQHENYGSHGTASFGKKRKPKPLSVMLDIYPIPDSADPNRKSSRPRAGLIGQQNQASTEEYDSRRPIPYYKGSKYSPSPPPLQPISLVAVPGPQNSLDDEDRQQMIFHLNLYPKRRNKFNRNDIIPRSHRTAEDTEEKVPAPFETVAKHLADHSTIQGSKFEDTRPPDGTKDSDSSLQENPGMTRYEESELDGIIHSETLPPNDDHDTNENLKQQKLAKAKSIPANHRPDFTVENITRKFFKPSDEKFDTIVEGACKNCKNLTIEDSKSEETGKTIGAKDIDTVEGFDEFADGLLATD